ncbi:MAG TPA: hypothetical protein DIV86_05050, partial [Alphaproteobacteria bacterium]|nr:hypothetical protein [Alphaproteobacteria bacterium]
VNEQDLNKGNYDDMHFPRFVYGMFKREQFYEALQNLPDFVEAIVLDRKITKFHQPEEGKTILSFEKPAQRITFEKNEEGKIVQKNLDKTFDTVEAELKLIGIGSPEPSTIDKVKNEPNFFGSTTALKDGIEGSSFYEQFKSQALKIFKETGKKVELGIMGTGPSFLDMANMIYNDKELREAINITAISSSGISKTYPKDEEIKNYKPKHFKKGYTFTTIQELLEHAIDEVKHGLEQGVKPQVALRGGCRFGSILWGQLNERQRKEFYEQVGAKQIDNLLNSTTKETQMALDNLDIKYIAAKIDAESIENQDGKLKMNLSTDHLQNDNFIRNPKASQNETEAKFDIVVNCMGFGKALEVDLLQDGLDKGFFQTVSDPTKRTGVEVNENMEIGNGAYMNGYLVAGTGYLKGQPQLLNAVFAASAKFAAKLGEQLFGKEQNLIIQRMSGKFIAPPNIEKFEAIEQSKGLGIG